MNDQQRAAMQMALEALEWYGDDWDEGKYKDVKKAQAALREALAQPQGEWVDLTDEEIREIHWSKPMDEYVYARSIIAKFKEKNTPPVVPQGEPVAWIHRYKTGAEQINTAPPETYVGWTHTPLYTTTQSVEAAIERERLMAYAAGQMAVEAMRIETLEKAAKVCEGSFLTEHIAAAIRSMK